MSRTHVSILGVQIPLRGLAYVTSTPPTAIVATLGEYNNYYSESSLDIAKAIEAFEKAESKAMKALFYPDPPFHVVGVNRQIFNYAVPE